jgi:hypothetical protein
LPLAGMSVPNTPIGAGGGAGGAAAISGFGVAICGAGSTMAECFGAAETGV